jgi:hypothetical protein
MDALMPLIRGPVGMTEKKPIAGGRHPPGQDMDQVETLPRPFQIEADGQVEVEIIIAQNHSEPGVDRAQFIEDRFLANIAQVPDLIDVPEEFRDAGNPLVVRIGDDAYGVILWGGHPIGAAHGGIFLAKLYCPPQEQA